MLEKIERDDEKSGCGKTFRFFARISKMSQSSPYSRMESDGKEDVKKKKSKKGSEKKKGEEFSKGKENDNTVVNKEVKEKKSKKKTWKRVRQAALTTCRYIGMGAAHMSPGTIYAHPNYYVDPKCWNKSFSSTYKPKVYPQTPHWTNNMMFSGW